MTTKISPRISQQTRLRFEVEHVWPELTRFYGISPLELWQLPKPVIKQYVKALPQLKARESLSSIEVATYPHMKKEDARATHRRLLRRSGLSKLEAITTPTTPEEGRALYAAAGIGFEEVPTSA